MDTIALEAAATLVQQNHAENPASPVRVPAPCRIFAVIYFVFALGRLPGMKIDRPGIPIPFSSINDGPRREHSADQIRRGSGRVALLDKEHCRRAQSVRRSSSDRAMAEIRLRQSCK